jgi:hypothetical protein
MVADVIKGVFGSDPDSCRKFSDLSSLNNISHDELESFYETSSMKS